MYTATQPYCYNCFQPHDHSTGPCPNCGFDLAANAEKYPLALPAGSVLNGRYIVGRVLGQGGFGITYLALDTQLNARVAIKEFLPSEIATRTMEHTVSVMSGDKRDDFAYGAERFREEARTLAKFIGHPNIAGVSSYFDENDTSYFVMDYIEGVSFKSYIANAGGQVSVDDALNVMIPVLRALAAVHAEGFIHRDVTPDNIYISKDGNVKLLDFGSARYSIGDKSKSLDVILKVGYAPKEQYIRRGRQGPYTDVYSCAACFYAALTGYLPPESLERLDQDTLVPVSQCGVEIPEWLDKAILKGLAVQPEDRFQSAVEFLDAIENQRVVEVPVAGGAAAVTPAKKPNTKMIAGIAAAVIALVVGITAIGGGGSSGGNNEDGTVSKTSADYIQPEVPSITIRGEEYSTDLTKLDLSDKGLSDEDIEPLKYMVNLTDLRLGGNNLSDLTPLAGLTQLRQLRLNDNELEDLTPLTGLTKMGYIRLDGNPDLCDLSPLSGMTRMEEMQLPAESQIADLSPLAGMTELQHLTFDGSWGNGTMVTDLSPLRDLTKLVDLRLVVECVEDLTPLTNLTNLQELSLVGPMNIMDLTPLSNLSNLRSLEIQRNGDNKPCVFVKDLTALRNLTQLNSLILNNGGLESLNGIQNMSKLTYLQLNTDPSLADISALSGVTALEELYFYTDGSSSTYSYIRNLDALAGLNKLKTLYMQVNGLENLDGIAGSTSLQKLELWGSESTITETDALKNLTQLRTLRLPTGVDDLPNLDISGLTNLVNLEEFTYYRGVTSYDPLAKLTKLKTLHLGTGYTGTDPADLSAFANLTNLTDMTLSVGSAVTDITPLGKMSGLQSLYLSTSNDWQKGQVGVTDISPLGELKNLRDLTLNLGSAVTDISALRNLTNLQNADIRSYGQSSITDWSPVDHVPSVSHDGHK